MKIFIQFIALSLLALLVSVRAVSAQENEPVFNQAELDQMLATIALYPDALLSQILMASTYPLEVDDAARWSKANPGLYGEQAVAAVTNQDWDPSVKALVAVPQVLARMTEDPAWTRALGDAFLYQETQVMDTIQALRQRAYDAGNLNSTENVRVVRENQAITIMPVNPQVVYVPYYNPLVVYGSWWWPTYLPAYWATPGVYYNFGFSWGSGVFVSSGFFFGGFDWYRRHVYIARNHPYYHRPQYGSGRYPRYAQYDRWRHNPKHRRGVAYRHQSLRQEFGASGRRGYTERTPSDWRRQGGSSSQRRSTVDNNFSNRRSSPNEDRRRDQGDQKSRQHSQGENSQSTSQNRWQQRDRNYEDRAAVRARWRQNSSNNFASPRVGSSSGIQSSPRSGTGRPDTNSNLTRNQFQPRSRNSEQRSDSAWRRPNDVTSTRNDSGGRTQPPSADGNREMSQRRSTQRMTNTDSVYRGSPDRQRSFTGNPEGSRRQPAPGASSSSSRMGGNQRSYGGTSGGYKSQGSSRSGFSGRSSGSSNRSGGYSRSR